MTDCLASDNLHLDSLQGDQICNWDNTHVDQLRAISWSLILGILPVFSVEIGFLSNKLSYITRRTEEKQTRCTTNLPLVWYFNQSHKKLTFSHLSYLGVLIVLEE